MATRKYAELEPGMVLASDLFSPSGQFLLPRGAVLEERSLRLLGTWKVAEADVALAEAGADIGPEVLDRAQEYVREFFLFVDLEHPAMTEIFRLAVLGAAHRMMSGWEPPSFDPRDLPSADELPFDQFFKGEGSPRDLVLGSVELSTFPDVYYRIMAVLDDENSSAANIAAAVSRDTSLAARLLKIVNSAFYGFQSKVDSVTRAVTILGVRDLGILVTGIVAVSHFKDIPPQLVDMKSFWRHSVICGIYAKLLAERVPGLPSERFFVAGLLHDIGKLVMYKRLPYASTQALRYSLANSVPEFVAEDEVMGFDHAEVGRLLLTEWRFPETLVDAVAGHHGPVREGKLSIDAAVVHVADLLAVGHEIVMGARHMLPGVDDAAWKRLGISPEVFEEASRTAEREVLDVMTAFFGG